MNFSYYDLKQRSQGDVVEVTLSGSAANVFLADSSNFSSYKSGRRYTYHGGNVTRSPVRLVVPRSGHWYLVIDLGGYPGQVKHSIRILPGPLKPLREAPLSSMPSLVQGRADSPPNVDSLDAQERVRRIHLACIRGQGSSREATGDGPSRWRVESLVRRVRT